MTKNKEKACQDCSKPLQSSKHEKFAQYVADGKKEFESYQLVFPDNKYPKSAASRLLSTNDTIKNRIQWLKEQYSTQSMLSRADKRNFLAQVIQSGESMRDKLQAVKIDNDMSGHNAPKHVKHESNPLAVVFRQLAADQTKRLESDKAIPVKAKVIDTLTDSSKNDVTSTFTDDYEV